MKRILSLFLTLILAVGIFSVVPASAETYTEVDCPKLVNCADLNERINRGTTNGMFVKDMEKEAVSEVYKLVVPEDSYLFMQYGGVITENYSSSRIGDLNFKLYIYSDINLTKVIFSDKVASGNKVTLNALKEFSAGTYFVQIERYNGTFPVEKASLFSYFGYLPLDTEFFSVDFVKSENKGKKVTLKINSLDAISNVYVDSSNRPEMEYSRGCEYKLKKNKTLTLNLGSSSECYFTILIKDVFGNRFENWYGIMTEHTTVIENIPETVKHTGKPIIFDDLKVITGYTYNNCATYYIRYISNTNIGTAKVTIVGNGNFIGSVTKEFKIIHAKHKNIKKVTVKPTYFENGYKNKKVCTTCGTVISNGTTIPTLKLKTPKFSLTSAKKQFEVKYTKVKDATGFEVRYKLGESKYKTVKVNTKNSVSKIIKNLKKGSYKVQVRAVVESGKKIAYSNWSSLKTVKVK